jgi:hypothetical protein
MAMTIHNEEPMQPLLHAVTAVWLVEMLQSAGCRANVIERDSRQEVHSAVQGLGFFLRMGNTQAGQAGCIDFTWVCPLAVRGEPPQDLVESWNRGTRFGHLSLQGDFMILSMDTLLAGGVTENHLRGQLEIWVRLLQQLHVHLRRPAAQGARAAAA